MIHASDKLVFDLDIEEVVQKLTAFGVKEYPDRRWFIEVVFWDDSDYLVRLVTSNSRLNHEVFEYQKSEGVWLQYHSEEIDHPDYGSMQTNRKILDFSAFSK